MGNNKRERRKERGNNSNKRNSDWDKLIEAMRTEGRIVEKNKDSKDRKGR